MSDVIRIFVGSSANGEDAEAEAVLAWSIKKHCSRPYEITWMRQSRDPASFWHGWDCRQWGTPFSAFRFGIPEYCGFQGKAIYTDVDVWFQDDPANLWDQAVPEGKIALAKGNGSWRLCVSLWDCAAAQGIVPSVAELRAGASSYLISEDMKSRSLMSAFSGNWNCLDGEQYAYVDDPRIKALHYTEMETQVHLPYALPRLEAAGRQHWYTGTRKPHPRADVQDRFDELLAEATAAGEGVDQFIPAELFGPYPRGPFELQD